MKEESGGSKKVSEAVIVAPTSTILKYAEEAHQYMREYIRNADQKAIFYFTISSALLTYMHNEKWAARWLKPVNDWHLPDVVTLVAMVGLAIAGVLFLATIFPRLRGSKRGLIFFAAVAEYDDAASYVADISKSTEAQLAEAKLRHNFELAAVAKRKYACLSRGTQVGAVAMVLTLVLLVFSRPS